MTKYETTRAYAEQHSEHVTSSISNWKEMLEFSGRLYKYPFDDQLLIKAQRPNATACASMKVWNSRMGRAIKKGTKGIALTSMDDDKPVVSYLFDLSDTIPGRGNTVTPVAWQINDYNIEAVTASVRDIFGAEQMANPAQTATPEETLSSFINQTSQIALESFILANYNDLEESIGSEDELEEVKTAITASTTYTVLSRCGLDTSEQVNENDFSALLNIGTDMTKLSALGNVISQTSEGILREIETAIKQHERKTERSMGNEPITRLETLRGLSSAGLQDGGSQRTVVQVRTDEAAVPPGTQTSAVRTTESDTDSVQPLPGDTEHMQRTVRQDVQINDEEKPTAGPEHRPSGTHTAHLSDSPPDRGTPDERFDLQLTETPPEQGGVLTYTPFSDFEITEIVKRYPLPFDGSINRLTAVATVIQNGTDHPETLEMLKGMSENQTGLRRLNGVDYYNEITQTGMTSGRFLPGEGRADVSLTWSRIAQTIEDLHETDEYLLPEDKALIPEYQRTTLAEGAINFYRGITSDMPDIIKNEMSSLESSWYFDYNSNDVKRAAMLLESPENIRQITDNMQEILGINNGNSFRHQGIIDDLIALSEGRYALFTLKMRPKPQTSMCRLHESQKNLQQTQWKP